VFFCIGNVLDVRYSVLLTRKNQTLNLTLYTFAKHELNVANLSTLMKYCVLNEREKFVQKYSYTTQISWFLCWDILLWLTLYLVCYY